MRRLIQLSVALCIVAMCNAQIPSSLQGAVNKATTAVATGSKTTTDQIMSKLTGALSLSADQKTQVTTAVNNFVNQKLNLQTLSATKKTEYAAKLTTLKSDLSTKLKSVVTPAQFAKFQSLKPAATDTNNVLSQLFN